MPDNTQTVPSMDQSDSDASQDALLADILNNSPIMESVIGPQSESETEETDESDDDDLEDSGEDANEDDNEGEEGDASEDEAGEDDDESTQETDESEEEADIDWDFQLPIKIDGEESSITLEELRKGYQTQKHLSKQGRELGEQRKALEAEQSKKISEMAGMADAMTETLMADENKHSADYNTIKNELTKLREDGDKFGIAGKKDELEVAQEKYWTARNSREEKVNKFKEQQAGAKQADWDSKVKDFSERIEGFVPNFDEKTAIAVRAFAIEQGVPTEIVDQVTSPEMVKFVNDYRLQMEKLNKGTVKRKRTVKRKVSPTKKNPSGVQKAKANKAASSAKLASGTITQEEGDAFLMSVASKHFNKQ